MAACRGYLAHCIAAAPCVTRDTRRGAGSAQVLHAGHAAESAWNRAAQLVVAQVPANSGRGSWDSLGAWAAVRRRAHRYVKLVKLPMLLGTVPVSRLPDNKLVTWGEGGSMLRLYSTLYSRGPLCDKGHTARRGAAHRYWRPVMLPMLLGMFPLSCMFDRLLPRRGQHGGRRAALTAPGSSRATPTLLFTALVATRSRRAMQACRGEGMLGAHM